MDVLRPLGKISHHKMFGEHCLFINGQMFAIINADGEIFIKTQDLAESDTPFTYQRQGKAIAMHYVKIDGGLLDDVDDLIQVIGQKLKS